MSNTNPVFGFAATVTDVPDTEVGIGTIPVLEITFRHQTPLVLRPSSMDVLMLGEGFVRQFLQHTADRLMGRS